MIHSKKRSNHASFAQQNSVRHDQRAIIFDDIEPVFFQ